MKDRKEYAREYYRKNRERILSRRKTLTDEQKESAKEYAKEYYEEKKDEILEKQKEWKKKNKEKWNEYQREWAKRKRLENKLQIGSSGDFPSEPSEK